MTVTALVPAPAYAQFGGIVYDPSRNYAQTCSQPRAPRADQQPDPFVQNQATSLINEARNLTSLPTSVLEPLQQPDPPDQQLLQPGSADLLRCPADRTRFGDNIQERN